MQSSPWHKLLSRPHFGPPAHISIHNKMSYIIFLGVPMAKSPWATHCVTSLFVVWPPERPKNNLLSGSLFPRIPLLRSFGYSMALQSLYSFVLCVEYLMDAATNWVACKGFRFPPCICKSFFGAKSFWFLRLGRAFAMVSVLNEADVRIFWHKHSTQIKKLSILGKVFSESWLRNRWEC